MVKNEELLFHNISVIPNRISTVPFVLIISCAGVWIKIGSKSAEIKAIAIFVKAMSWHKSNIEEIGPQSPLRVTLRG
jgi:hypothetical protein